MEVLLFMIKCSKFRNHNLSDADIVWQKFSFWYITFGNCVPDIYQHVYYEHFASIVLCYSSLLELAPLILELCLYSHINALIVFVFAISSYCYWLMTRILFTYFKRLEVLPPALFLEINREMLRLCFQFYLQWRLRHMEQNCLYFFF